nr:immunoglobulin heavy chain junction region [Mus musculus]
TVQDTVVALTT